MGSPLPGIRPSRSGITPSWPSSTMGLDTKLKSTPSILHQTPTSLLPVVETVKSTSGTWLKEDISKRSTPNPQLTLSCSPQNFTGSSLVPNKVSRSTISQTRNSSTDTKPPPLTVKTEEPPKSVALPSSGPRTNNPSTPVSPMDSSESSKLSTPKTEHSTSEPTPTSNFQFIIFTAKFKINKKIVKTRKK